MAASATKEDEWVEVNELSNAVHAISGSAVVLESSVIARIRTGPHRRRSGGGNTSVGKTRNARSSHSIRNSVTDPRHEAVWNAIWTGIHHVLHYIFSLGTIFFRCIRTPLVYIMVLVILWLGTSAVIGYVSDIFLQAIRPTCKIPGISNLLPCNPPVFSGSLTISSASENAAKWADYPTLTNIQSDVFEQLLQGSVGGQSLSLEIKKAEMATLDLITQVKVSNLNARERLARSLSEFVQDAKKTSRCLQKFASKVSGAVDNVMTVNYYALTAIESARAEDSTWKWLPGSLTPLNAPQKQLEAVIMRTFGDTMTVLASNMERLIIEAEISLHNLNNLEERLEIIHAIIAHEDSIVLSAKNDLLEELWTIVGGNKKSLKGFDYHLSLLRGIARFRRDALQQVVSALQTLQAMSNDIEDLRERIAAPNLIGETIPPEVHITSIQTSLDRMRRGRIHAKKVEDDSSMQIRL